MVSWNRGGPNSFIFMGFSSDFPQQRPSSYWGTPAYGNPQISTNYCPRSWLPWYIYILLSRSLCIIMQYIYMITNHTQITVQITVYIILDMFRMFHPTRILTPHWRPYFFWWLTSKKNGLLVSNPIFIGAVIIRMYLAPFRNPRAN